MGQVKKGGRVGGKGNRGWSFVIESVRWTGGREEGRGFRRQAGCEWIIGDLHQGSSKGSSGGVMRAIHYLV
jgi:hypothetical protein